MKSKKTLTLVASVVLAVMLVVSGTFAWFTTQESIVNKFQTSGSPASGAALVEVFTPPEDWKPGQEVVKEVGVVNTGEAPVLTRIHFEEVLQLIKPVVADAAIFSGSKPAAAADKFPVLFDATHFSTGNGWYPVTTTADTTNLGGLKLAAAAPTNVTVLAKKVTSGTVAANNLRDAYHFTAFANITAGDYSGMKQATNINFNFDKDAKELTLTGPALGTNPETYGAIGYSAYGGKFDYAADWSVAQPDEADIVKAVTEGMAVAATIPNIDGAFIEINFDASVDNSLDDDTWFYNEDDGYFYYIGVVAPGTATTNLLKSLTLNEDAGNAYSNMDFDLIVKMSAIQNTQDAVVGAWGLADTDPIVVALTAFCE